MNETHLLYVYSAMTQATGALIALVGIFIVYSLQTQRDRIEKARQLLCSNIASIPTYSSVKTVIQETKIIIDKEKNRAEFIKPMLNKLENCVTSYHWTIKYGAIGIAVTTILFLFFIVGLYLHNKFPNPYSLLYFWVSLISSFLVVIYLGGFSYKVLKKEGKEYSMKDSKKMNKSINKIIAREGLILLFAPVLGLLLIFLSHLFHPSNSNIPYGMLGNKAYEYDLMIANRFLFSGIILIGLYTIYVLIRFIIWAVRILMEK